VLQQCELHNASYSANFAYINGAQKVDVSRPRYLNSVPYVTSVLETDKTDYNERNYTLIENLSYQSVMEAFGELMIGSLGNTITRVTIDQQKASNMAIFTLNTTIMTTPLANTEELSSASRAINLNYHHGAFQDIWHKHTVTPSINSQASLSGSIKEMFLNITISLMSSDLLQYVLPSNLLPYCSPYC
jgi:hypothetical protein